MSTYSSVSVSVTQCVLQSDDAFAVAERDGHTPPVSGVRKHKQQGM